MIDRSPEGKVNINVPATFLINRLEASNLKSYLRLIDENIVWMPSAAGYLWEAARWGIDTDPDTRHRPEPDRTGNPQTGGPAALLLTGVKIALAEHFKYFEQLPEYTEVARRLFHSTLLDHENDENDRRLNVTVIGSYCYENETPWLHKRSEQAVDLYRNDPAAQMIRVGAGLGALLLCFAADAAEKAEFIKIMDSDTQLTPEARQAEISQLEALYNQNSP